MADRLYSNKSQLKRESLRIVNSGFGLDTGTLAAAQYGTTPQEQNAVIDWMVETSPRVTELGSKLQYRQRVENGTVAQYGTISKHINALTTAVEVGMKGMERSQALAAANLSTEPEQHLRRARLLEADIAATTSDPATLGGTYGVTGFVEGMPSAFARNMLPSIAGFVWNLGQASSEDISTSERASRLVHGGNPLASTFFSLYGEAVDKHLKSGGDINSMSIIGPAFGSAFLGTALEYASMIFGFKAGKSAIQAVTKGGAATARKIMSPGRLFMASVSDMPEVLGKFVIDGTKASAIENLQELAQEAMNTAAAAYATAAEAGDENPVAAAVKSLTGDQFLQDIPQIIKETTQSSLFMFGLGGARGGISAMNSKLASWSHAQTRADQFRSLLSSLKRASLESQDADAVVDAATEDHGMRTVHMNAREWQQFAEDNDFDASDGAAALGVPRETYQAAARDNLPVSFHANEFIKRVSQIANADSIIDKIAIDQDTVTAEDAQTEAADFKSDMEIIAQSKIVAEDVEKTVELSKMSTEDLVAESNRALDQYRQDGGKRYVADVRRVRDVLGARLKRISESLADVSQTAARAIPESLLSELGFQSRQDAQELADTNPRAFAARIGAFLGRAPEGSEQRSRVISTLKDAAEKLSASADEKDGAQEAATETDEAIATEQFAPPSPVVSSLAAENVASDVVGLYESVNTIAQSELVRESGKDVNTKLHESVTSLASRILTSGIDLGTNAEKIAIQYAIAFDVVARRYGYGSLEKLSQTFDIGFTTKTPPSGVEGATVAAAAEIVPVDNQFIVELSVAVTGESGRLKLGHEIMHAILAVMRAAANNGNKAAKEDLRSIFSAARNQVESAIAAGDTIEDAKLSGKKWDDLSGDEQNLLLEERVALGLESWLAGEGAPSDTRPIINLIRQAAKKLYAYYQAMANIRAPGLLDKEYGIVKSPREINQFFERIFDREQQEVGDSMIDMLDVGTQSETLFSMSATSDGHDVTVADLAEAGFSADEVLKHKKALDAVRKAASETIKARLRKAEYEKARRAWQTAFDRHFKREIQALDEDWRQVVVSLLVNNRTPSGEQIGALGEDFDAIHLDEQDFVAVVAATTMGGEQDNRSGALAIVERLKRNQMGGIFRKKRGQETKKVSVAEAEAILGLELGDLVSILSDARHSVNIATERATASAVEETGQSYTDMDQVETDIEDALYNKKKSELLRTELRLLASDKFPQFRGIIQKIYADLRSDADMEADANRQLSTMTADDVNPGVYNRSMKKHAAESRRALWKGDIVQAAKSKASQISAYHMYRAAVQAKKDVHRLRKMAKTLTRATHQSRLAMAADGILEGINQVITNMGIGTPKIPNVTQSGFGDVLVALETQGIATTVMEEVINIGSPFTVQQARDATDFLSAASKLASLNVDAQKQEQAQDLARKVAALRDSFDKNKIKRPGAVPEGTLGHRTMRNRLAAFFAPQARMEFVVRYLDGGNLAGVAKEQLFMPLVRGLYGRTNRIRKSNEAVDKIFNDLGFGDQERIALHDKKHVVQGFNGKLSTWNLIMVFMNSGNEHNKKVLMGGYGLSESDHKKAINMLSKREMQLGQALIDHINSFKAEAFAQHRAMTGIVPVGVEATPIVTKHGTFAGGYVPIVTDRQLEASLVVGRDVNIGQNIGQTSVGLGAEAYIAKNHLKSRTDQSGRPLVLEPVVITNHLNSVIHDLELRQPVRDVWSLLSEKTMQRDLVDILGRELYHKLGQMVADVATSKPRAAMDGMDMISGRLRSNTTMAILGLRAATGLSQTTGLIVSAGEVGVRPMLRSIAAVVTNPVKAYQFVTSRSSFMSERIRKGPEREIREMIDRAPGVLGASKGFMDGLKTFAAQFIGYAQMIADLPTWMAAHELAITGKAKGVGTSEQAAIEYADSVVRTTQGGVDITDLADVQRKGGFWDWATMFYSFFSIVFNRIASAGFDIYSGGPSAIPKAAASVAALFAASFAEDLIRGRYDDEDEWEEWAKQFGSTTMMMPFESMVFVRDVAAMAKQKWQHGRVFGASPYESAIKGLVSLATVPVGSALEGKLPSASDVRGVLFGAGVLTGIPAMQLFQMSKGIAYLATSPDVGDNAAIDAYRAIVDVNAFGGRR